MRSIPRLRFLFLASVLVWGLSCGGSGSRQQNRPARSPALDYPPPAQETSQGEVVGADRVPPGDKLKTSPKVGTEDVSPGVFSAETPETTEPNSGKVLPPPKR